MIKDLIYAARTLHKSPVFAITAIATIALGVGASTAIFSVTNAVLLRKLPYKDPERLVIGLSDLRKRNVRDLQFSNADSFDLKNGTKAQFEDMTTAFTFPNIVPREDGTPEQVNFAIVSPNFFRLMGASVSFGRDFSDADGQPQAPPDPTVAPNAQPPRLPAIAILSYSYWQRRFGGSTAIFNKSILANGQGPLVVGVLAPGFELLFPPRFNEQRTPELYIAARLAYDNQQRVQFSHRIIGRLKPGVTIEQAQAAADLISAETRKNFLISGTAGYNARLEPFHKYLVADVQPAILALMGAVIFLLLIACANVGNLLLVRASLRERELAVRSALGGSWLRLVRQMLAEALLLAVLGTAGGLALAAFGIQQLRAIAPANLPRLDQIVIDPSVLLFTALAGLAAAAIFGLVPALRASRPDVMKMLRGSGRTAGLGRAGFLRSGVVIAEVALSFVLLIGSGLMFRSFLALQAIDPGFDPHGVLTFQLLGNRGGADPKARSAAMRDLEARLRALQGVESVTASSPFPLAGGFSPIRWGLEAALSDPGKYQALEPTIVLPGYFEMLRTRLLEGRAFTQDDNAPTRNVIVVDQMLAAKAFPRESAVGKRILIRLRTPEPEWVEIIGVVAHQRHTSLADPGREQAYFTDGFRGYGAVNRWAVRTSRDPAAMAGAIRSEIANFDKTLLIRQMVPMEELVIHAQAGTRFSLLLIGVFAAIAVLLAGVGLYGVLATVVRQRTAEIGVRMAMGAAPSNIFQLMVGQGMRLSLAGIGAGMIAAIGLTRLMSSMLVGVQPTDPVTYLAMAVLFAVVTLVACWLPARRAAGLDPTVALRDE